MYPVYLICLLISLYLFEWREVAHLAGHWRSEQQIGDVTQLHTDITANFWQHVWLHLTLLHGVVPDQVLPASGHAFIGPAWSLSLEWQFYLLAPLLFFFATRNFLKFAVISLSLVVAKGWLIMSGFTFSYGAFLPIKYEFFLFGITLYLYLHDQIKHAVITLAIGLLSLALSQNLAGSVLSFGIWMGFASLAVWPLTKKYWLTKKLSLFLTNLPISYLGKISFSTYLVHIFIVDFVGYQVANAATIEWSKIDVFLVMLLPTIVLTLAASVILHLLVEAPGMRIGKQVTKNAESRQRIRRM